MVDNVLTRCDTCAFWREGEDHVSGECHRHAPRPELFKPAQSQSADVFWPPTLHRDGCGDGLPKR